MRKRTLTSARSWQIEESIPFKWKIAGTKAWFDRFAEPIPDNLKIVITQDRDLQPVLADLLPHKELGLDTETGGPNQGDKEKKIPADGLDPISKTSEIVLFQIGSPDCTYVVEPRFIPAFGHLLKDQNRIFILQNAVHDYKFLYSKFGIRIARMFDTMIAEQLLTAGQEGRKVDLASLARKYPPHRLISKQVREDFNQWPLVLDWEKCHYAGRDVHLLFPIRKAQKDLIIQRKMQMCTYDEMRCLPVTAEMELTGVVLDPDKMMAIIEYYQQQSERIAREIFQLYNVEYQKRHGDAHLGFFEETNSKKFNLAASKDTVRALQALGLDIIDAKKDTLNGLDHPIGSMIVEWKECQKILSTYGQNMLNQIHRDTGYFHPRFFQHGAGEFSQEGGRDTTSTTATGRYTSNFQQIPRPERVLEEVTDPVEIARVLQHFRLEKAA